GVSGIFGGLINPATPDRGWRAAFVVGLIAAPLTGSLFGYVLTEPQMPANWAVIVAAGLLVGFGSRLGRGCTSGHGLRRLAAHLATLARSDCDLRGGGNGGRHDHASCPRRLEPCWRSRD